MQLCKVYSASNRVAHYCKASSGHILDLNVQEEGLAAIRGLKVFFSDKREKGLFFCDTTQVLLSYLMSGISRRIRPAHAHCKVQYVRFRACLSASSC